MVEGVRPASCAGVVAIAKPDHAAMSALDQPLVFEGLHVAPDRRWRNAELRRERVEIADAALGEELAKPGFSFGDEHLI